jgi:hypothetical protein
MIIFITSIQFITNWKKKQQLYARKVNAAQGILEPAVVICSSSVTVFCSYKEDISSVFPVHYKITQSYDSSKILITYRVKPKNRNDNANFDIWGYQVLDRELKPQWNQEAQMPYVQTKMEKWSSAVTRQGHVYQLLYSIEKKQYELQIIKPDVPVENHVLDLMPNLNVSEFRLDETKEGNISCTSFYSNAITEIIGEDKGIVIATRMKVKAFISDGLFFAEVSPEGKLLQQGKFEVPITLLNAYEDAETRSANNVSEASGTAGARDLKIVNRFFYEDGSSIIIVESQYFNLNAEYYSDGNKRFMVPTYFYGDVYAIKLDESSRLVWMKKIAKKQSSKYKIDGLGIKMMSLKGILYIFCLDNGANIDLPQDQVALEGGFLMVWKVDESSGEYKKYKLVKDSIPGTTRLLIQMNRIFGTGEKCFMEVEAGQDLETMVGFELLE